MAGILRFYFSPPLAVQPRGFMPRPSYGTKTPSSFRMMRIRLGGFFFYPWLLYRGSYFYFPFCPSPPPPPIRQNNSPFFFERTLIPEQARFFVTFEQLIEFLFLFSPHAPGDVCLDYKSP